MENWFDGTVLEVANEASIPNLAASIHEGVCAKREVIEAILASGVTLRTVEAKKVAADALSFCATGALSMPKKEIQAMVENAGHEWKSGVSAGLSYLIMADPNSGSSKAQKARKLGVKCIGEDEFKEIVA